MNNPKNMIHFILLSRWLYRWLLSELYKYWVWHKMFYQFFYFFVFIYFLWFLSVIHTQKPSFHAILYIHCINMPLKPQEPMDWTTANHQLSLPADEMGHLGRMMSKLRLCASLNTGWKDVVYQFNPRTDWFEVKSTLFSRLNLHHSSSFVHLYGWRVTQHVSKAPTHI